MTPRTRGLEKAVCAEGEIAPVYDIPAPVPTRNSSAPAGRRVLLTGGTGSSGRTVRLLTGGAPVMVLDDFSTGSADNLADPRELTGRGQHRPVRRAHPSVRRSDHCLATCP